MLDGDVEENEKAWRRSLKTKQYTEAGRQRETHKQDEGQGKIERARKKSSTHKQEDKENHTNKKRRKIGKRNSAPTP